MKPKIVVIASQNLTLSNEEVSCEISIVMIQIFSQNK